MAPQRSKSQRRQTRFSLRQIFIATAVIGAFFSAFNWFPALHRFVIGVEVQKRQNPGFKVDIQKPYQMQLSRGFTGWGLDLIAIDQPGLVTVMREVRPGSLSAFGTKRGYPTGEIATLQISEQQIAEIARLINSCRVNYLAHRYNQTGVYDGSNWSIEVEQGTCYSSSYFSNYFPAQISRFSNSLDKILRSAGIEKVQWTPLTLEESYTKENEVRSRIQR